jgi:phospholipid transport system substrate-binding protein
MPPQSAHMSARRLKDQTMTLRAPLVLALLLAAAPALAATTTAAPAPAASSTAAPVTPLSTADASAFAKKMLDDATAALTKSGQTDAQHLTAFQDVLKKSLALDVVGKFMLGENRKKMTAAQIARYDAVFPQYITKQYADQFKNLVGRPMEITNTKALNAKDVIVRAKIARNTGAPINVDWRVRKLKDGKLKMIDIIVSGVSIMLVKRDEFSAYIAKNGVDGLLARLEKEAKAA